MAVSFDDGYSSVLALAKPILDEVRCAIEEDRSARDSTYGMYFGDTGGGTWSVAIESGSTYTSFGYEDRMVAFGRREDGGRSARPRGAT